MKNALEKIKNSGIILYENDALVQRIDAHNKAHLSEKRYRHVVSVAAYSDFLANIHGIDRYKAYVAGLAHDCTKHLDGAQDEYFERHGITLTEDEWLSPKIHHQISGAHFAKNTLGIIDADILNAIRYHTTGRVGMSDLEKLVCLADSIEPIRDFEGVDKMRDMAERDLDMALIMSFDRLIEYVIKRGLPLNKQTAAARDYERKKYGSGIANS